MNVAPPDPQARSAAPPRLWVMIGDKLGDNAQVAVIADALGWPATEKRLAWKPEWVVGKPRFRASLDHLDRAASDALEPPWPDLVVTIGRRPSMAALWVKEQAASSGVSTRVVIIGRPRREARAFDLILAPPQYPMPPRPNVLRLALPLFRLDRERIAAAGEAWRARLAPLPRPLTAVFVGGPTGPFRFDAEVARGFVERLARTAGDQGALYVSTSRRTPGAVADAIAERLPASATLYRWSAEAADNPYQALLAHADRFVVTGDSISMILEAAQLGRPLAVFPLPQARPAIARMRRRLGALLQPRQPEAGGWTPLRGLGDWLIDHGVAASSREFEAVWDALRARGLACLLGEPFPERSESPPDELPMAAARIRALLGR